MAWSNGFLDALEARTRGLQLLLERLEVYHEPGTAWSIASHGGLGADAVGIVLRGLTGFGACVTPRTAGSTIGGIYVPVTGDISAICTNLPRGTVVQLRAGFEGWDAADFETIFVGQVRNLRGMNPNWKLEIMDLFGALKQRMERGYDDPMLFQDLPSETQLTAAYTPGDITLEVGATLTFHRETGGEGVVRIVPTTGDPFYLTYTGTATGPTRFTGVSTTGQFGTSAVAALVGDDVVDIAHIAGHPVDVARKILCSTGAGTNGTYDTLPLAWGLALSDDLVDHDDADHTRDDIVNGGFAPYTFNVLVDAEQTDSLAWLAGVLGPAGIFLTQRMGKVTVRAIDHTGSPGYPTGLTITDADILSVEDWEAFDFRHVPEYNISTVTGGTGLTADSLAGYADAATIPSQIQNVRTLPFAFSSEEDICEEVVGRMEESDQRVPEYMKLRLVPKWSQLAPGDIVNLTTTKIHSRRDGAAGYTDRPAIVLEVFPEWVEGACRVSIAVYPESEDMGA